MTEKRQQTTVTIDTDTSARLERLAKANGVSKKDFISLSLDYFEKYGINPARHESPAQEMQKLIKRVDQVVAFQKVQEREFIRPAMGAVMETEARIKGELESILEQLDSIRKKVLVVFNKVEPISLKADNLDNIRTIDGNLSAVKDIKKQFHSIGS